MEASIYEFESYQKYLVARLDHEKERGIRSRLARHLSCQTSFISQVLTERSHLSLEHAIRVCDFLKLSSEESRYFMFLVQMEKSGSSELHRFFEAHLKEMKSKRELVRERIKVRGTLKPEDQAIYYSNWWYGAIHVLVAFDEIKTTKDVSQRLHLSPEVVERTLDFLLSRGLVVENVNGYGIGAQRIHLGRDSPLIARHHANWRIKAVEAQERPRKENLHYSSLIGISRNDALRIRNMLLDVLQNVEGIIVESKEEAPYVMLLDLFEL
jgi:uncharacterized protein (TIGR02147 family)